MSTEFRAYKARIIWIILLLAALAITGGYFYLYPEHLPAWATKTSIGRDMQTTTVYKWQDPAGGWHVSDQPPPAGTKYEVEKYTRDTNVMPLVPESKR